MIYSITTCPLLFGHAVIQVIFHGLNGEHGDSWQNVNIHNQGESNAFHKLVAHV